MKYPTSVVGQFLKKLLKLFAMIIGKYQSLMNDKFEFVNLTQQTKSLLKQYGSNYRSR